MSAHRIPRPEKVTQWSVERMNKGTVLVIDDEKDLIELVDRKSVV